MATLPGALPGFWPSARFRTAPGCIVIQQAARETRIGIVNRVFFSDTGHLRHDVPGHLGCMQHQMPTSPQPVEFVNGHHDQPGLAAKRDHRRLGER